MPEARYVVRVLRAGKATAAGVGFVVGDREILTCAHVVNAALGREQRTPEAPGPDVRVQVDFPILGGAQGPPSRSCRVAAWVPPLATGTHGGDVAGLVIVGDDLPPGAGPARLAEVMNVRETDAAVFGYPADPPRPDGAFAACRLRGPVGGGMLQLDPRDAVAFRVQPGYSGSPVVVASDGVGDAVAGMLAVASGKGGPRDAYAIPVTQLIDAWPAVLATLTCPYRGLEPFRAQDAEAGLFVGREGETAELRRKVDDHPLVMVVGPSGVGKSSLVTAGLIPSLLHTGEWVSASFRPGQTPFNALALALYELECPDRQPSVEDLDNRAEQIRERGLATLTSTLSILLKDKRILLHVDQFEEIFTACLDGTLDKERTLFLDRILPSVDADNAAFRLVCTLRADFLGKLLAHPGLGPRLQDRLVTISPMDEDALERAVIEPARIRGVVYDGGLAHQIAIDAAKGAGGLPLMQFALTELWPYQRRRRLTLADYHEFGRVAGALERYAERVFTELEPRWSAERIRRVMLACVRSRGGAALATRGTVRKDSFILSGDWDLVKQLVDQRLLMTGKDPVDGIPTVEVAHEALIRSWKRLAGWVDNDADFQRWLTIMDDLVRDNGLLDDARLGEAERWLAERLADIPAEVRELVEHSGILLRQRVAELEQARRRAEEALRSAEEARRRAEEALDSAKEAHSRAEEAARQRARTRRQLVASLVVFLVLVAGAVGFIISSRRTVAEQRIEALSRMVADEADRAGSSDPSLAMQLSLAAYRIAPTPEARGSLLRASTLHAATQILGNAGAVNAVAISPDGHTLAAGSADQVVRLYDLSNPQGPAVVSSLTDHIGATTGVVFSPDGRTLASGSRDNTVRLWDLTDLHHPALLTVLTDQALADSSASTVTSVAFSPDGRMLADGSSDHTVRLWDLSDLHHPTAAAPLTGHTSKVNTVAFSPDGRTLASGSDDRTVWLWDLTDPHHPSASATLGGHTDAVYSVAFSPDGRTLASGSRDDTARLWDLTDVRHPTAAATLTGSTVAIESVAFSPDGHALASGSQDGVVRLWDLTNPDHPTLLTGHTSIVGTVAFSPDGHTLASGSFDGTVRLWNPTDPHHLPVFLTGSLNTPAKTDNPLDTVAFSPDGHTLASGGNDRLVRLWDLTDPRHPALSAILPSLPSFVESVAFSPNGRTLAIADGDHTIRLWDLSDPHHPTESAILTGHTSVVEAAVFSPDGHTLASASSDHTIRLWDLADPHHPTASAILAGHTSGVEWVAFSPDGHTLASAGDDGTVRLWNVSDSHRATAVATLTGYTDSVEMVAFSPDGRTLASAGQDGTIRLWNLTDPAHPTTSATLSGHTDRVEAVTFSPDGHTLASGSFDGTVRLWDLSDQHRPADVLTGHPGQVEAVAFAPDGRTLASGGGDGTIRLWDTAPEQTAKDICALIVTPLTSTQWQQYIPDQAYNPPCRSNQVASPVMPSR